MITQSLLHSNTSNSFYNYQLTIFNEYVIFFRLWQIIFYSFYSYLVSRRNCFLYYTILKMILYNTINIVNINFFNLKSFSTISLFMCYWFIFHMCCLIIESLSWCLYICFIYLYYISLVLILDWYFIFYYYLSIFYYNHVWEFI